MCSCLSYHDDEFQICFHQSFFRITYFVTHQGKNGRMLNPKFQKPQNYKTCFSVEKCHKQALRHFDLLYSITYVLTVALWGFRAQALEEPLGLIEDSIVLNMWLWHSSSKPASMLVAVKPTVNTGTADDSFMMVFETIVCTQFLRGTVHYHKVHNCLQWPYFQLIKYIVALLTCGTSIGPRP